ncbi:MAG: carboxypeptidase-like regulatory domain-containing protein [Bacteroidota bacterium]|nr:carboxypeptidase-like regulatory domain-containing protein [Bacteroidota bacterium]
MKRNLLIKLLPAFLSLGLWLPQNVSAQITVSGTVFDSTKLYVVPGVNVSSTSGLTTITDSLGAYHINVSENDSLSFFYRGKSTIKFPVKAMGTYNSFDISLHVRVSAKYKLLQSVTVFADNYHRDSAENRMEYSKIFNFEKPRISSSYEDGGPAGIDLDQLIGMFNRRKNKANLAFQNRLVDNERDRYVNYRFSPKVIQRVTGLSGDTLLKYRKRYMPSYDFVVSSTLAQFYAYILNTSYAFKKEEGIE